MVGFAIALPTPQQNVEECTVRVNVVMGRKGFAVNSIVTKETASFITMVNVIDELTVRSWLEKETA